MKRGDDRHTEKAQKGESNVTLEAKIRMMKAQTKECQQLPESGRRRSAFSPGASAASHHLDQGPLILTSDSWPPVL